MKIETHLSPNCSEATFVIVDWKHKKIINSFQEASDSCAEDSMLNFIEYCNKELGKGNNIEVTENQGNNFHPKVLDAIVSLRKKGVKLDFTGKNTKAMFEELCQTNCNEEDVLLRYTKSKVELLASGYYGRKKNENISYCLCSARLRRH